MTAIGRYDCGECGQNIAPTQHHTYADCQRHLARTAKRQPTSPRTKAGRALLEALPRFFKGHAYWRDFEPSAPDRIFAIEAEAAAEPTALLLALVEAWFEWHYGDEPSDSEAAWQHFDSMIASASITLDAK